MNAQELNKILELHKKWLNDEPDGKRADLYDANLSNANLSDANLSGANLYRANLSRANLSGANLYRAKLSRANLSDANLSNANLRLANLSHADLSNADLSNADLYDANLSNANLSDANLYDANLSNANLSDANLSGANLYRANLSRANLSGANLYRAKLSRANLSGAKIGFPLACPETGSFEAWKKVTGENGPEFLVKLLVPADAKRSSATTNKCRCEFADVLEITNIETNQAVQSVENMRYVPTITYRVGERVYPDSFDENRWNGCSHGIHFFVDKESAMHY